MNPVPNRGRQKGEMVMKKEAEILIQYVQADFSERLFLFLQNPGLRDAFQEIKGRDFAAQRIEEDSIHEVA